MVGISSELWHEYVDGVEDSLLWCGALSMIGSFSVIMTGILFPVMVKRKIYMQMILMVSVSDFLSALTVSWGVPSNATLCSWQSGMGRFFFRTSWMWSTLIILTLYFYISRGVTIMRFRTMNFICWSGSLVLALLPLTSHISYGEDDDRLGKSICSFRTHDNESVERSEIVKFWIMATSYVPCVMSVVIMVALLVLTKAKVNTFDSTNGRKIQRLVSNTALYPLITSLSWIPNIVAFVVAEWGYPHEPSEYTYWNYIYIPTRITYAWACLSGLFVSLAFFINSREARRRWLALITHQVYHDHGDNDGRKDSGSTTRSSHKTTSTTRSTRSIQTDASEDNDSWENASQYEVRDSEVDYHLDINHNDNTSEGNDSTKSHSPRCDDDFDSDFEYDSDYERHSIDIRNRLSQAQIDGNTHQNSPRNPIHASSGPRINLSSSTDSRGDIELNTA
jgi:hypothetical protein